MSTQPMRPGLRATLSLEYPMSLGVYDSYDDAQRAVDYLSDHEFPVQDVLIVGTDLKQLERVTEQEAALNAAILGAGQDYERLAQLSAELQALAAQRDELESEWLEAAEQLE